ncbi:hypothetical protein DF186_25730 [Enterococcus hirae]|nr:hypothetical protein DF186_25730 [Enterococcus hirae]
MKVSNFVFKLDRIRISGVIDLGVFVVNLVMVLVVFFGVISVIVIVIIMVRVVMLSVRFWCFVFVKK